MKKSLFLKSLWNILTLNWNIRQLLSLFRKYATLRVLHEGQVYRLGHDLAFVWKEEWMYKNLQSAHSMWERMFCFHFLLPCACVHKYCFAMQILVQIKKKGQPQKDCDGHCISCIWCNLVILDYLSNIVFYYCKTVLSKKLSVVSCQKWRASENPGCYSICPVPGMVTMPVFPRLHHRLHGI